MTPLLCLKPSMVLVTRKQYSFALGLHQTTVNNNSTKEFPALTNYLRNASDQLHQHLQIKKDMNKKTKKIAYLIKSLNNKVTITVLAEAARNPKTRKSALDILKAPFLKISPMCTNNNSTTFAPILTMNYVSIRT